MGMSIVSLAGGVGGAKLAEGFAAIVESGDYTIVVNTADDFDHLGLRICPDLDTVVYTLGGIANPATGWGIVGDTTNVLDAIRNRGGESWFLLGDQDFATHIMRTAGLTHGRTLTDVTSELCNALAVGPVVMPMTDDPVATLVQTIDGTLAFQDYFVRRQQQDDVLGVTFQGAAEATANPPALEAIAHASLLVINPSNPIVSIGPIIAVPGYGDALRTTPAIRVAVSPIIGGKALKGPADRMLTSLGHESSALGVARIYAEFIDGMVIDHADRDIAAEISELGIDVLVTDTIMSNVADRARLAGEVIEFASTIDRAPA